MAKVPLGVMPPTAVAPAKITLLPVASPCAVCATVTTGEPLVTVRGLAAKSVGGPNGVMS